MKNNARVYTKIMPDGLPSIIVDVDETPEQIERRIREEEFDRIMRLLKANNGVEAMSPAMRLLYEDAYYEQGYGSDIKRWKRYLNALIKGKNE